MKNAWHRWVVAGALSLGILGFATSCGEVDDFLDCANICDRYDECLDDRLDRNDCIDRCQDSGSDLDACDECLDDDGSCFECSLSCAGPLTG